jgi:hypothetical protein
MILEAEMLTPLRSLEHFVSSAGLRIKALHSAKKKSEKIV